MKPNIYTNSDGYIALISAIIISVLLLAITFTLSFTGFYSRFNVLDSENKKISFDLAEACLNTAMVRLAEDPSYTPSAADKDVYLDPPANTKHCVIVSITGVGSSRTIQTQSIYNRAYTDLQVGVTLSVTNVTISSWQELAHF